jgi:hypothetical protein
MSLSRRRVLAALATVGGAGAIAGSGTAALLGDTERTGGRLTTGTVDLVVSSWDLAAANGFDFDPADPDGVADGPRLSIPLQVTGETDRRTLLRFGLPQRAGRPNNPASLWLRADCPPAATLAEFLDVELSYATADGTPGARIVRGSLREVADSLRGGLRLDGDGDPANGTDCLTDEVYVLVEYDLDGYVGSETTRLPIEALAVQCRNSDPGANPFPAAGPACEPAFVCDCCWTVGKVETDDPLEAGRTYRFDEGLVGYGLRVTDVDGDSGVAFDLVSTDGDPVYPLCSVAVKGGRDDVVYDRTDGSVDTTTDALDGAVDGLVYAPENPNSGGRYAISYVLVSVCAPALADGSCPADVASGAASVGSGPRPKSGGPDPATEPDPDSGRQGPGPAKPTTGPQEETQ